MISTVIVDDEESSRIVLRNLLTDYFPGIEVSGEASNADEAYQLIKAKQPDLVFLDIQMPRANGFTLLKRFNEVPFEVIFVTSYDRYAINAIRFSALDYLLKPVEVKELRNAIVRAEKSLRKKNKEDVRLSNLIQSITHESEKKIAIHAGEKVVLIDTKDIVYVESDGSYCSINTLRDGDFVTAKNLKDFEEYVGEHSSLLRIHRSCMINVKHIKNYSKGEPCIVEMCNGKTFEVARRKKVEILEKLK